MKILLVYPKTPSTFWSFHEALKFISRRASEPPLGLLTVAAMLPAAWDVRLIDMNVGRLRDRDLRRADYVFLSGMIVQIESFKAVIRRCNDLGVKIVAGGPLATAEYRQFQGVDHFVLGEAELTLPPFLRDLAAGNPQRLYQTTSYPEISTTPPPRWDLLKLRYYASVDIQYSRGCPFDCEFCNITQLNGRRPRTKSPEQFLHELDLLLAAGWRGGVFIVDDNFIGNRPLLKQLLLPALVAWQETHHHPFAFNTEVSINLADDPELMGLMVAAGFNSVFVGIETPDDGSLAECGKTQNRGRDLAGAVRTLQQGGLAVSGGFIVGFDNDSPEIFDTQISFIQQTGIVMAMVGLLTALPGTKLSRRLLQEHRLLEMTSGNNMDGSLNFIPKMEYKTLMQGYRRILSTIYAQPQFYRRVRVFLDQYRPPRGNGSRITLRDLRALLRSFWKLGILARGRLHFWALALRSLRKYPRKFPMAITMAIYGFHFRHVVARI